MEKKRIPAKSLAREARLAVAKPLDLGALLSPVKALLQSPRKAASPDEEEQFLLLYKRIEGQLGTLDQVAVAFVGLVGGEGTSTIAFEFSRVMAEIVGKRVLLIETGKARKREHAIFMSSDNQGWEQDGEREMQFAESIHQFGETKLYVSPFSEPPNSVATDDPSERLWHFLDAVRPHFKTIVLDAGPLLDSWQGLDLCAKCEGVVMVVEAGESTASAIQSGQDRIQCFGGRLLGFVLNKSRRWSAR